MLSSLFQIHYRRKSEITFGYVDITHFSGKIINILKQKFVNLLQTRKRTNFKSIYFTAVKKLYSLFFTESFFNFIKLDLVCDI